MAINIDKAHEFDKNGFSIGDDNGNVLFYMTTGSGAPSGPAPINTWYFDKDSRLLYYKFGALDTDWRQIRSADIAFNPTGYLNFQPTDTNVHLALARFGNFSVADLTEAETASQGVQDSTTSNGWVSRSGFPFLTAGVKTAGTFSLRWSTEIGQTTKNRNYGLLIRWRPEGGIWATLSSVELSNSRNNDFITQSGFKEVVLLANSKIEVDMQFGQTTGGGTCLIRNSSLEVRRIGA